MFFKSLAIASFLVGSTACSYKLIDYNTTSEQQNNGVVTDLKYEQVHGSYTIKSPVLYIDTELGPEIVLVSDIIFNQCDIGDTYKANLRRCVD